jgi:hypothetical protein
MHSNAAHVKMTAINAFVWNKVSCHNSYTNASIPENEQDVLVIKVSFQKKRIEN